MRGANTNTSASMRRCKNDVLCPYLWVPKVEMSLITAYILIVLGDRVFCSISSGFSIHDNGKKCKNQQKNPVAKYYHCKVKVSSPPLSSTTTRPSIYIHRMVNQIHKSPPHSQNFGTQSKIQPLRCHLRATNYFVSPLLSSPGRRFNPPPPHPVLVDRFIWSSTKWIEKQ